MRDLTEQEISEIMNHGSEIRYIPGDIEDHAGRWIEAQVRELSGLNVGTACGGPDTFHILNNHGYSARRVRGYLIDWDASEARRYLVGMIWIKIQTENTAYKIEDILDRHGSALRFDGPADDTGFMVFEDE